MKNNFLMWLILSFIANMIIALIFIELLDLIIDYSTFLSATLIVALTMTFYEMNEEYEKNENKK